MTTPQQPVDRPDADDARRSDDRPGGGVRGALNELFGRGDREDVARQDTSRQDVGGPDPARQDVGRQDTAGGQDTGRHEAVDAGDPAMAAPAEPTPAGHTAADRVPVDPDPRTDPGYAEPAGSSAPGPSEPVYADERGRSDDPDRAATSGPAAEHRETTRVAPAEPVGTDDRSGPVTRDDAPTPHARPDTTADADRDAGTTGASDDGAGTPTGGPGTGAGTGADSGTLAGGGAGQDAEGRERLVSSQRAESYASRWDAVKGGFVDEPRQAVREADGLVGELLDELQSVFSEQRRDIERSLDADQTSTEDLRLALRRYRSFFDRLLSI